MKDELFCDSLSCKLRSVSPPWIPPHPAPPICRSGLSAPQFSRGCEGDNLWNPSLEVKLQDIRTEKKKFPFQWKTGHGWFFPGLMLSARTQIPSPVALSNTPIYKTTILGTEQHIHDYFLLGILITQGIELPASEIWSNNVKQKLVMQNVPLEII